MADKNNNIELTKEEAIVLFEFLRRFNKIENSNVFVDQAEERVLWDIECQLEKELTEPFQAGYEIIVKKAREVVRDERE